MLHHTGTDREQLTMFPLSLDEMVDQDNPVRIIDLFVNRFDFVGRLIERSQYTPAVEANSKRIRQEKEKYLLRQQIVEHPFETIKRQWGFDHVFLKGLKKNEADFGLVFTTYNLRRILSILGIPELKKRLGGAFLFFSIRLATINKYGINYFFRRYSIA
ncbi:MAG: transposase [Bacteroidetes bacterium]|nr:transposase [Bacteroidota bacterium]